MMRCSRTDPSEPDGLRPPAVTDPTKRHAAVAVVLVDSEIGEDRVDPAPVDDWMAGRPMPEAGLDGSHDRRVRWCCFPPVPQSISPHFTCRTVGAVLLQLRWLCLEGRHDPVDGLEQPVFAWK